MTEQHPFKWLVIKGSMEGCGISCFSSSFPILFELNSFVFVGLIPLSFVQVAVLLNYLCLIIPIALTVAKHAVVVMWFIRYYIRYC
jgi:hypothetical protein